jgi:hypothetical protein
VGSIDKRLENLERLVEPPEDEGRERRRAIMRQVLDELAALTACRARNSYRGGSPPTPIQPTDPAGEALGYPYTKGQLMAFAARRVIERDFTPELDSGEGEAENVVGAWVHNMRMLCEQAVGPDPWDKIEAEGPPEPTAPWH